MAITNYELLITIGVGYSTGGGGDVAWVGRFCGEAATFMESFTFRGWQAGRVGAARQNLF